MAKNELMGVAPQNLATDAQGVSLTPPQLAFFEALLDMMKHLGERGYQKKGKLGEDNFGKMYILPAKGYAQKEKVQNLYNLGSEIGLSEKEVDYIQEWVLNKGIHWLTAEKAGLGEGMEARLAFRNPVVRTMINYASERGMCVGTVASKDEVADYYTQRMRSFSLPQVLRDRAAEGLSKLMGYYPKEGAGGGQTVNVQINCVNPYGTPVDAEVTDEN